MAVFQVIRDFFSPASAPERASEPAPHAVVDHQPAGYEIKPLTTRDLGDVIALNARCFTNGDHYTSTTFHFLLSDGRTLAYRLSTETGEMAGFLLMMLMPDGSAHLTTIGIAPEHRRRGLAEKLLEHIEKVLIAKEVSTIMLEVRVGNISAQNLYTKNGYAIVQRMNNYYNDGEDGFMMVRSLV